MDTEHIMDLQQQGEYPVLAELNLNRSDLDGSYEGCLALTAVNLNQRWKSTKGAGRRCLPLASLSPDLQVTSLPRKDVWHLDGALRIAIVAGLCLVVFSCLEWYREMFWLLAIVSIRALLPYVLDGFSRSRGCTILLLADGKTPVIKIPWADCIQSERMEFEEALVDRIKSARGKAIRERSDPVVEV